MVSALLAGNFTYACLNRERIALRAVRAEKAVTQTGVTVRGKIGRKKLESIFFIIQIVFDYADFISASGGVETHLEVLVIHLNLVEAEFQIGKDGQIPWDT